ncbi:MAG: sigma-70 family RNA polymerase sigma factor [Deltaproteobacteria bacterium]|nr:sigma-70 family RNA polymerase sigma factor [Deltaproteobacteria bacterium]
MSISDDGTVPSAQTADVEPEIADLPGNAADAPGRPSSPEFRLIFERECSFVWNTLRRLGIPDRDADDAAQDVFVVVHRHLHEFDPTRPLRPWLFGICYRVAVAHRRRARTTRERLDEVRDVPDSSRGADVQLEQAQERDLVRRALDTLDLDRRALIVMHEYEGYPVPQIAETLGVPLNTAYSRLRLAREQFVAAVRRLQAATPPQKLKALAKGGAR